MTNSKDNKRIWSGIKQIIQFKPKTNLRVIKIVHNNVQISDPKAVAEVFNNYFASIGTNLSNTIYQSSTLPMGYLNNPLSKSFFFFPVTSGEIETEILHLSSSKATGPSSIPINILKLLSQIVSKPLEILFNT